MNLQLALQQDNESELWELPTDWKIKQLKDIATLQRGKDLPKQEWKEGKVPIVGSSGIMGYHNKAGCNGPVVITGRSGSIGKLTYIEGEYWPHNTALYVKDFHGNNPKFIYYLMQTLDFKRYATGVSVPTLNRNFIHMAKKAIPPLSEQKSVAGVLSTIQYADVRTNAMITSLKQLKKSLMKHLFTQCAVSLKEMDKVKLKETDDGTIPEEWKITKVGEIFEVQQGKQLSAKESHAGKTKRPFLRTANVLWGKIDLSTVDSMYFTDKEIQKLSLQKDDVLVCEGGDVGRTALWKGEIEDSLYQNHLYRLRPLQNNYDPLFFVLWMEYAITVKGIYVQAANRTTIPNLS